MAGIAATLNVPDAVESLAVALAARGSDGAVCRVDGAAGTRLDVVVRAVIPSIARVVGTATGSDITPVVAAIAVDGVVSMTELDAAYATAGPAGLLHGRDPYAVVIADAERDALVLGRNGASAGLYYARLRGGWVVASEPGALLSAGVRTRPEPDVVARFVATGACDGAPATFLDGIAQVRPDEVVVLDAKGVADRHQATPDQRRPAVSSALERAIGNGRLAVLLRPGQAGAAVLGAALARPDRPHPMTVHTAVFADLAAPASHTPAVLVPLPHGTIRHAPHEFNLSTLDLDGFLREMGEPVGDLDLYLLWAVARDIAGGVDVLVDSGTGRPDGVARVNDRITARYGVSVRCPLRESAGVADDDDLAALLNRTLPPAVVRYASRDSARSATAAEIVLRMRDEVAAALAVPRPWAMAVSSVESLRRLAAGEAVDAEPLLRAYLVERWLGTLELDPGTNALSAEAGGEPPEPVSLGDLASERADWQRWPVRTQVIEPGSHISPTIAWYAEAALAELRSQRAYREALRGPWLAVLAAKPVAVAQQRVSPLWSVQPGRMARLSARLIGRRLPLLAEAWTMQAAIDELGPLLAVRVVLAALFGWQHRLDRLLPDGPPVFAPRPDAVAPADSAVVLTPLDAEAAASTLVVALRYALPAEVFDTLAGCAVVRADRTSARVLGFAPGPFADAIPRAEELVERACADNPAGQGRELTPLVLLFEAPTPGRRDRTGRDPRLLDVKLDRIRPAPGSVVKS